MRRNVLIFFLCLAITVFSYSVGFSKGRERDSVYKELDIFAEALALVDKKYVDEKKAKDLIYGAISGLLNSLDAYSQFLTPEEHKELITDTEGKFGGLGIEITVKNGILTIITPIQDTPAWEAGLEAGDTIIKINGVSTEDITLHDAVKQLRGDPGTQVAITIFKESTKKPVDVTITRAIINVKDIKHAQILSDGIGYVSIAEFREHTSEELDKALEEILLQKPRALIIDVRNNPGGLLYSAIEISSKFLKDGLAVVSTKSRSEKEMIYKSLGSDLKILDIPLAVLINKGSASGSEILAAALRDNNRAVLVGQTSFGKGSVQTVVPLSDGSALRLTTSKYYTPKAISIHETGIKPDIEVRMPDEKDGDTETTAGVKRARKKLEFKYTEDAQIMRALDVLKGMIVFTPAGNQQAVHTEQ